MAITVVNSSSSSVSSTMSVAPAMPVGTIDGDLMILMVSNRTTAGTVTPPAGWTSIQTLAATNGANRLTMWKRVASSETGPYTCTVSGSQNLIGAVLTLRGASATLDAGPVTTDAASSVSAVLASITTVAAGAMTVRMMVGGTNGTVTWPSSNEEGDVTGSFNHMSWATRTFASPGATGTETVTQSFAAGYAGIVISLAPDVTQVAMTRQLKYDVLAQITMTRKLVWAMINQAATTRQLRWSMLNQIAGTRQLKWDVLAQIALTRQLKWNLLAQAARTRRLLWTIIASTQVSATRKLVWTLTPAATATRKLVWGMAGQVTATRKLVWTLAPNIAMQRTLTWGYRVPIAVTRQLVYLIANNPIITRSLRWRVGNAPTRTQQAGALKRTSRLRQPKKPSAD